MPLCVYIWYLERERGALTTWVETAKTKIICLVLSIKCKLQACVASVCLGTLQTREKGFIPATSIWFCDLKCFSAHC